MIEIKTSKPNRSLLGILGSKLDQINLKYFLLIPTCSKEIKWFAVFRFISIKNYSIMYSIVYGFTGPVFKMYYLLFTTIASALHSLHFIYTFLKNVNHF